MPFIAAIGGGIRQDHFAAGHWPAPAALLTGGQETEVPRTVKVRLPRCGSRGRFFSRCFAELPPLLQLLPTGVRQMLSVAGQIANAAPVVRATGYRRV